MKKILLAFSLIAISALCLIAYKSTNTASNSQTKQDEQKKPGQAQVKKKNKFATPKLQTKHKKKVDKHVLETMTSFSAKSYLLG